MVIHAPTPRSFRAHLTGAQTIEDELHAALAARLSLLLDEQTDCFRLFTGRQEGFSGLSAELLGPVVVLEVLEGRYQGDEALLRRVSNWYSRMLGTPAVCCKRCLRRRDDTGGARPGGGSLVSIIKGRPAEELVVTECGIKYLVKPVAGLPVGLFLDQRDNRRRVRALAEGNAVLNLFAYTCSFSVAAAVGGAHTTTSVDLAAASLEWGKHNFAVNGIGLDNHTFIKSDALDYLRRACRQEKRFDLIVLDPPSFSRAKRPKRTFTIRSDLVSLVAGAIELLDPGGHLLVSTNSRELTTGWMVEQVRRAAQERTCEVIAKPRLPVDFAADPDHQKSIVVRLA